MVGGPNLPAQFDVSPTERRMIEDRAKIRAELRREVIKQGTNPHRHGHGGYLFDPAMQRWISMRSQQWYYFKPHYKSALVTAFVVFSCLGYGHWFKVRREARDKQYRAGLVSYRDREFKFV